MLKLACGRSSGETALFTADALVTDIVVACIGIGLAFALRYDPALAVIAAMPILLIHRALVVPTLREQAYRDHKTGLLNARGLEDAAEHEFVRATRFDRPLSLLLCDVDDLRGINNRHGHLAGDAALEALADTFCAELRDYDLCGRFGGDEFVVILPETALDEALSIAVRVEEALASRTIHAGRNEFRFSVSIGAAIHAGDLSLSDLIARADAAMYDAKRSGNAPQPAAA
jgi:diguanylate cyclase (GGDEF)-like protein